MTIDKTAQAKAIQTTYDNVLIALKNGAWIDVSFGQERQSTVSEITRETCGLHDKWVAVKIFDRLRKKDLIYRPQQRDE